MIAFTLTEWVVVGLVLVFGWVLGLLSSSGGKKWRARYDAERDAHASTKAAQDERYRELETRHRELERSRVAAPVAATTATTATSGTDDLSRINGLGGPGAERLRAEGITRYEDVEAIDDGRARGLEERLRLAPGTIDREDWRGQARALREGR